MGWTLLLQAGRNVLHAYALPRDAPYHVLGFSADTIQRRLRESGFVVLAVERVGYFPSVRWHLFREKRLVKGMQSVIGRVLERLGDAGGLDVYGGKPPLRTVAPPRSLRRPTIRPGILDGASG